MNVKELAEQAGIKFSKDWGECYTGNVQLERFAELVRQDEREVNKELIEALNDVLVYWMSKGISMKEGAREAIVFRKAELALVKAKEQA